MITEEEYNARIQDLLDAGIDARIAPMQAVLDFGIEKHTITQTEADTVLTTFQDFLYSHPKHVFLSPRESCEKRRNGSTGCESEEEAELWNTIQPVLDKAQGF